MPADVIVAFTTASKQPPTPQRARPARLRSLSQFASIVAWICSAVLQHRGEPLAVLNMDSVAPALRDQVEEETVRTLATLDPIAESFARNRARRVAGDLLTMMASGDHDLKDPEVLRDRGNVIADAVLERYRSQLIYGGAATAPEGRN